MTSPIENVGDLAGAKVFVLEDEFYLAMDLKEAIEHAGGSVVGPCADVAAGITELQRQAPHCAIIDIDLGHGPSFEMAAELRRRDVPFLFLTGYDAMSIPDELADIERIEKPAALDRVVKAIVRLTAAR